MNKKITIFLFCISLIGFSQSKSTGDITLSTNMTANFTLNNDINKVSVTLKGPSDRWFALGIGVTDGFGMGSGDVVVYNNQLSDRNFNGMSNPRTDSSQDWTLVSNNVSSGTRTLVIERALTNSDANDYQLPYATTTSIDLAWAHDPIADFAVSNHQSNRGFASGTFTNLSTDDFSLNSTSVYPNPASDKISIKSKTNLLSVNIYTQTGALVKETLINGETNEVDINVSNLKSGVYMLEIRNGSDKSWKKILIE